MITLFFEDFVLSMAMGLIVTGFAGILMMVTLDYFGKFFR